MPKLTAYQACSEVRDLWTRIAREAEKGGHRNKWAIPGPWLGYRNACPCCEYVEINQTKNILLLDCALCPMALEWKSFFPLRESKNFFCETHLTPYLKWSSGPKHYLCYDLSFFAWLIVELAEEAMERIRKEAGRLARSNGQLYPLTQDQRNQIESYYESH